jgi:RHS repeat-associated protein
MNLLRSFVSKITTFTIFIFKPKSMRRKLVCLALILSLLILPNSSFAFNQLSSFAESAMNIGTVPINYFPSILKWLFGSTAVEREETLEDRLAAVSQVQISPSRFVSYEGDTIDFSAFGIDYAGRTIQGLVFSWESSDTAKIQIDDNGRAQAMRSGMCEITCHAGTISKTARVLVKQGRRPRQTDEQWLNDQNSLSDSSTTGVGALLPNLLDKLIPTAHAQSGGYAGNDFGFDEMWNEPRNLMGNPRNRVLEPMMIGSVLPEGSNYNFAIPIIGTGGRGLGANLNIFYNSRVWSRHGNYVTFAPVAGFPFAGFSLGFGRIVTYGTSPNIKYVLVDADGTQHYLGTGTPSTGSPFQTTDGTHITYDGSALHYNDGTRIDMTLANNRIVPSQINDSNGNFIKIAYKWGVASPLAIDYVTDTKGRNIQFNYDATSGNLISITAPGYGGTSQNPVTRTLVQFDYESRTLSYTFNGLTVENAPSGTISVLKHIYFPGITSGYLFTYSDYGMIYNVSRRRQMSIDANGVISDGTEIASLAFNYPVTGSTSLTDSPAFTQRTETPGGQFSYSSSTNSLLKTKTFTIARPDSSNLALTRSTDSLSTALNLLVRSEVTKNSTSYSKVETTYTTDGGNNIQPQSITTYDDATPTANQTKVDFDYDNYGNVTNKRDYGFQISGNWQVRRRTHFTYKTDTNYINAYLRSLVTLVENFDALENTNDGDDVLIAKTANIFDDYAATGGMVDRTPKPPGHDSALYTTSYTLRGNITGTTQWTDIANNISLPTRLKKYDRMGRVVQEQVSCCKEKNFTYAASDYWSSATTMTDGSASGLHLSGNATYDFNTDVVKWVEYANLGKRWSYYDAALRLIQEDLPIGGSEYTTYNDGAMTATFSKPGLSSSTVTYDGWGRTLQQTDSNGGQVNTSYDGLGRVQSRTNPFQAGGTPGPQTTYTYDAMGRAIVMTLPDSQTVLTTYNGSTAIMTDQVSRQIKRETDGLGRLVKVVEQDISTGSLTLETTYTYNLLDKLININQGNQIRAFKYDALGRLLYQRIPEQTATINDGTGTYWTTKYTYTDFNAVATRTDARGVITTYTYDNLNRLTAITYNTSGAPGVLATSGVGYTFDTNQSSPTNGLLLNAGIESYSYDSYKRLTSITRAVDSINYTTPYQYGTGNLRSQVIYPSGRVVNINRDTAGRISSLTDASSANYLSNVGYNVAGQVTGLTLGNGAIESYGYDANRLQLTSQSATKNGSTLLSLTYNYQATTGQSGTSTTAGNAGQLMSISGTTGGQSESAAYTYDNLGRIATSNQTTNSVSAQRRFIYDRWGNRTSEYDATAGGTQIQSVSLEQSSGVPTNRLTSVTTSGATKNYTYDAAGNVTDDGTHSYQYDAENRLVNVDGGSTASYSYDHNNNRIKKTLGTSVTHFVWEGSQMIAEHDGITGAMITDYIYSGSRMVAKYNNSTMSYFLSDRLSIRLVLDSNGNIIGRQSHLPFGEDLNTSGTTDKHRFTSYERDTETTTDYAVNRQYNENIGRFYRPDPVPLNIKNSLALESYGDPQGLNKYNYVRNDPINLADPKGLNLCFGYIISLLIVNSETGQIVDEIYLGFITIYCESSVGGGGGGGSATQPTKKDLPKAKFSKQKFEQCVKDIWGGDPNTADGRFRNSLIDDILSQMHYVSSAGEAGQNYGVYFDYSKNQAEIADFLRQSGVAGITEPQIAGYAHARPSIIYFANDVFPNGVLSGTPGSKEYEYGSAVLFHEIGNWIAHMTGGNRPRQGGSGGDRDNGSNLEQCIYGGWVYPDGRVHQAPR